MSRAHAGGARRWLRVLLALLAAGVIAFAALLGVVVAGDHDEVNVSGQYEVMIVLGCKVEDYGPSVLLRDRLETALAFWQEHPELTIVVSGGQGSNEPVSEARSMCDYLVAGGVPEEQILLEDQSHNTLQNLQYSQALLQELGLGDPEEMVIVSNGFHLTRVRLLSQRVFGEAADTLAAPSSHRASLLKMYLREPLALVKSFIFDQHG